MTEIKYSTIGQGSRHEVYMLHGVKGGVIGLITRSSPTSDVDHVIIAIRHREGDSDKIRPEFISDKVCTHSHYKLCDMWGWSGRIHHRDYPEISKHKALYMEAYWGRTDQYELCVNELMSAFKIIKEIYDKNTRHRSILERVFS